MCLESDKGTTYAASFYSHMESLSLTYGNKVSMAKHTDGISLHFTINNE